MERDLLRQIVVEFVREEHPELLDEFTVSFDDVADSIENKAVSAETLPDAAVGFDSTVLTGTVIAAAGWIAAKLLEAAFRDSVKRDLLPRLNAMEKLLTDRGAEKKIVKSIRRRVEAVMKNMSGQ